MKSNVTKPKGRELKRIYKKVIDPSATARLNAMAEALQWFDVALEFADAHKMPFLQDTKLLDLWNEALELRGHTDEKHLHDSLLLYEKIAAVFHPVKFDNYYKRYLNQKPKWEAERERHNEKWASTLQLLQDVLKPINFAGELTTFEVVRKQSERRKYHPDLNVASYSLDLIKEIKHNIREVGLLPVMVQEVKATARSFAMKKDMEGGFVYDSDAAFGTAFLMLENVIAYCASGVAPKRLVKRPVELSKQPLSTLATKKSNRAVSVSASREKEGGFVIGSGMHTAFRYWKPPDGQKMSEWKEISGLQKLISADARNRTKAVAIRSGWKLEFKGKDYARVIV